MTEKPTDKVNTNNDQVIEIKENAESSNIDKPAVAGWRSLMNMFCVSNQKAEVKMFKIQEDEHSFEVQEPKMNPFEEFDRKIRVRRFQEKVKY